LLDFAFISHRLQDQHKVYFSLSRNVSEGQ